MSAAEEYMRTFLQHQHELNNRATEAVAQMAQANIDMIRSSGMGVVAARHARAAALSQVLRGGRNDDKPTVA